MKKVILFLALLMLSSCGTISSAGHVGKEQIFIQVDQEDATVKVNNVIVDVSKGFFLFDKESEGVFISVSKPGYIDSNFYLKRELNPFIVIADVWLIIPLIVDSATNEIYTTNRTHFNVFLSKEGK